LTQRHERRISQEEQRLIQRVKELAGQYGRYGYRRMTAMLKSEGWRMNRKRVERVWLNSGDVLSVLFDIFMRWGIPGYIRSDYWSEFIAKGVWQWLGRLGVGTLFIEPGSPWENGCIKSFNGKLRDELLNKEIFTTLLQVKALIENRRRHHNTGGRHSSLGYRPPAPEAILSLRQGPLIGELTPEVVQ